MIFYFKFKCALFLLWLTIDMFHQIFFSFKRAFQCFNIFFPVYNTHDETYFWIFLLPFSSHQVAPQATNGEQAETMKRGSADHLTLMIGTLQLSPTHNPAPKCHPFVPPILVHSFISPQLQFKSSRLMRPCRWHVVNEINHNKFAHMAYAQHFT